MADTDVKTELKLIRILLEHFLFAKDHTAYEKYVINKQVTLIETRDRYL